MFSTKNMTIFDLSTANETENTIRWIESFAFVYQRFVRFLSTSLFNSLALFVFKISGTSYFSFGRMNRPHFSCEFERERAREIFQRYFFLLHFGSSFVVRLPLYLWIHIVSTVNYIYSIQTCTIAHPNILSTAAQHIAHTKTKILFIFITV